METGVAVRQVEEKSMKVRRLASDIGIGLIGGYVGTKVMEPVSMKLYELESKEARRRED